MVSTVHSRCCGLLSLLGCRGRLNTKMRWIPAHCLGHNQLAKHWNFAWKAKRWQAEGEGEALIACREAIFWKKQLIICESYVIVNSFSFFFLSKTHNDSGLSSGIGMFLWKSRYSDSALVQNRDGEPLKDRTKHDQGNTARVHPDATSNKAKVLFWIRTENRKNIHLEIRVTISSVLLTVFFLFLFFSCSLFYL